MSRKLNKIELKRLRSVWIDIFTCCTYVDLRFSPPASHARTHFIIQLKLRYFYDFSAPFVWTCESRFIQVARALCLSPSCTRHNRWAKHFLRASIQFQFFVFNFHLVDSFSAFMVLLRSLDFFSSCNHWTFAYRSLLRAFYSFLLIFIVHSWECKSIWCLLYLCAVWVWVWVCESVCARVCVSLIMRR